MEHLGGLMLGRFGGKEKLSETIEGFKRFRPLIPEPGQARLAEMKEKMMPLQENVRKLFEYIKRAKA
jgi:hypothetical protein